MNNIILDIGTHKAEELRVLFGDKTFLFKKYLNWWIDWIKWKVKGLLREQWRVSYNASGYMVSPMKVGLKTHSECVRQIIHPKNYLSNVKIISIDPVAEITVKSLQKINKKTDITYVPIAILPHDDSSGCRMANFYISHNSLSSSLFSDERKNKKMIMCPAFDFKQIIDNLQEQNIINKKSAIVLRMNCEGSEFAVIKSMIDCGIAPKNILGSLADVGKKYGSDTQDSMEKMLKEHLVKFNYFKGSDPATWGKAFYMIEQTYGRIV